MISIKKNNVVHNLAGWSWWQCLSCESMCSPPHVFVPGIRGQPLFSGHQLPLPNNLLPKLLWQCKAWRSMLKTKSSNGWSQQWLTTQSTSSRKGAIDSVGPNYCPTGVACAKLLIVWASSVHDAQFSHNNLTVFDAKLEWHTRHQSMVSHWSFPWKSWGK